MKTKLFFLALVTLLVTNSFAQDELPLPTSDGRIALLTSLVDNNLQKTLEKEINSNPLWKTLINQKKMAIGLVDLRDTNNVKFARLNGNHMMYAASLPKIAVLLAAMDAIDKKELIETKDIRKDMRLMISKSNNQATTRMIDRLGYDKIEAVMRSPKYKFYDENFGGGLWVGKRYGGGGNTNREPLKNLSHAAPEARIFRKSGSWKNYHSDSVLVWGKDDNRRYILVALIEDSAGEQIIRDLIKPIEKVLRTQ